MEHLLVEGFAYERVAELASFGIFLVAEGSAVERSYAKMEERLEEGHWPPFAAAYHLLNHHQESQKKEFGRVVAVAQQELNGPARAGRFIEMHGPPPTEFYEKEGAFSLGRLTTVLPDTNFARIARNRRSCRSFVPGAAIALDDLSGLLRLVFGTWGIRKLTGELKLLLKTSPSGGSLHPIEAFPIIFRCEAQDSGIYHYRSDQHAMAQIRKAEEKELRRLAPHWAQGQDFVATCSLLVLLVARFDRSFWKYRERENAYSVVLQDAGHLSQTFQLAATELSLGSFYTGAINSQAISQLLDLKYPSEAPIGILGLGVSGPGTEAVPIEVFSPDGQGE